MLKKKYNFKGGQPSKPILYKPKTPTETLTHWPSKDDLLTLPSESKDSSKYVALFDFCSNSIGQLKIKKGDLFNLLGFNDSKEWCEVENEQNEKGWVPFNHVASVTSIERLSWFHGKISRSEAEYLLKDKVQNSFLVRERTSNEEKFCVSLVGESLISHYLVLEDENKKYSIHKEKFSSLPELVHFYSTSDKLGEGLFLNYPVSKVNKPVIYEYSPNLNSDDYEINKKEISLLGMLGCGQYGEVYEGIWKRFDTKVAVKILKDSESKEEFIKEAAVMKKFKHPNLLKLIGLSTHEIPFYIITEFMSKGNLLDLLHNSTPSDLDSTTLLYMAYQILSAMTYLEEHNFIHRDLAARNCLVEENHIVKVSDFGLARLLESDNTYTAQAGSKLPIKWTAPEGLSHGAFSVKSDVWAFGILLFELVSRGQIPYPSLSISQVYSELEKGVRMEKPENCPLPIYNLMLKCWNWNPEDRPSFKQIQLELENFSQEKTNPKLLRTMLSEPSSPSPLSPNNSNINLSQKKKIVKDNIDTNITNQNENLKNLKDLKFSSEELQDLKKNLSIFSKQKKAINRQLDKKEPTKPARPLIPKKNKLLPSKPTIPASPASSPKPISDISLSLNKNISQNSSSSSSSSTLKKKPKPPNKPKYLKNL